MAFREELERLARSLDQHVGHVLLEPPPGWTGEQGHVTTDVLTRHLPPHRAGFDDLICGPTLMAVSAERSLAALQAPSARVHSDVFDWV